MMVTLYTTHCPRCIILEKKLTMKNIEFETVEDITKLEELGIQSVPMLSVDGGDLMDFATANKWINSQGGNANG